MGSSNFRKDYISHLEKENLELKNKLTKAKETFDKKIVNEDIQRNDALMEEILDLLMNMPPEIDGLFEQVHITMSMLKNILIKKSEMVRLSRLLSAVLQPEEPVNSALDLIHANIVRGFVKRAENGINSIKRGTAKVSPMIKGHVIATAPRIHLNRVSQPPVVRNRIVSESPTLSPITESSPVMLSHQEQYGIYREVRIPLQRLDFDNYEDSPRASVSRKKTSSSFRRRKRSMQNSLAKMKQPSSSSATEEDEVNEQEEESNEAEVEEQNQERGVEEQNQERGREDQKKKKEDEEDREENSSEASKYVEEKENTSDIAESSIICDKSTKGETSKGDTGASPKSVCPLEDPMEGPSWLLDGRPKRNKMNLRSSLVESPSCRFVTLRKPKHRSLPKLSTITASPSEILEKIPEHGELNNLEVISSIDKTGEGNSFEENIENTDNECQTARESGPSIPEESDKNESGGEKRKFSEGIKSEDFYFNASEVSFDTSDMNFTEVLRNDDIVTEGVESSYLSPIPASPTCDNAQDRSFIMQAPKEDPILEPESESDEVELNVTLKNQTLVNTSNESNEDTFRASVSSPHLSLDAERNLQVRSTEDIKSPIENSIKHLKVVLNESKSDRKLTPDGRYFEEDEKEPRSKRRAAMECLKNRSWMANAMTNNDNEKKRKKKIFSKGISPEIDKTLANSDLSIERVGSISREGRPKRRAAPTNLQEPGCLSKLRRN